MEISFAHMTGTLLGGLGLFLVGMMLMTDGLKLAAGGALRNILAHWTSSRLRGLVAGFSITALVQSSSAVTVAAIGFANAGLLTLEQAVWVIFGSNVGTTMTGWIVALIGFKLDMEVLALPLVGIGMVVKVTGGATRRSAFGQALVGFGLLFLGIGVLKEAFDAFGDAFTLPAVDSSVIQTIALYTLVGVLLTTLMQSSSAALVIALGAAEGGLIPLAAAAAVVIGANLGTTTTALLTVWGATPTAKRVAVSHVLFNVATALVAALILVPMLGLVALVQSALGLPAAPATTLALFHSAFNILGVLLMWPLADRMIGMLSTRFATLEEVEGRPKFLDATVLNLPAVAADALLREIGRLNSMGIRTATAGLSIESGGAARLSLDVEVARRIAAAIGDFVTALGRAELPAAVAEILPAALRTTQRYLTTVDIAAELGELQSRFADVSSAELDQALTDFKMTVVRAVELGDAGDERFDLSALEAATEEVGRMHDHVRLKALQAGSNGQIGMATLDAILTHAGLGRRTARQLLKAARALRGMRASLAGSAPVEERPSAGLETPDGSPAALEH